MVKMLLTTFILFGSINICLGQEAPINPISAGIMGSQTNTTVVTDLTANDRAYTTRQIEMIDQIARTRLGTEVRGNLADLTLLQQIVDRDLMSEKDVEGLQALGAVMANVMIADVPSLEWKIYLDRVGRSRALCVKNSEECLFPITMLSRRMEVGLRPDVKKVYEEGLSLLDNHVPQIPYGGGPERRLRR